MSGHSTMRGLRHGGTTTPCGDLWEAGDVIGVLIDADHGSVAWRRNDVDIEGSAAFFGPCGPNHYVLPAVTIDYGAIAQINLGKLPFHYSTPAGARPVEARMLQQKCQWIAQAAGSNLGCFTRTGGCDDVQLTQMLTPGGDLNPKGMFLRTRSVSKGLFLRSRSGSGAVCSEMDGIVITSGKAYYEIRLPEATRIYRFNAGWAIYPNPNAPHERNNHVGMDNSSLSVDVSSSYDMFKIRKAFFGSRNQNGQNGVEFKPNKSGVRVLGCALDMDKFPFPECVWFIRETGDKSEFEESKFRRAVDVKFAGMLGVRPAVSMEDVANEQPELPLQFVGDSVPSFLVDLGYVGINALVANIFSEGEVESSLGDAFDDGDGGADAHDAGNDVCGWSGGGFLELQRDEKNPSTLQATTSCLNPSLGPAHLFVQSGRWYFEVELLNIGQQGAVTVGWALTEYFGDAYNFEGVGADRLSWGYASQSTKGKKVGTLRHSAQQPCHPSKKRGDEPVSLTVARFGQWHVGDVAWLERDDSHELAVISVTQQHIQSFGDNPSRMRRHFNLHDAVDFLSEQGRAAASSSGPSDALVSPNTFESGRVVEPVTAGSRVSVTSADRSRPWHEATVAVELDAREVQQTYRLHDVVMVVDQSVAKSAKNSVEVQHAGCIVEIFFAAKGGARRHELEVSADGTTHEYALPPDATDVRKMFRVVLEDGSIVKASAEAIKKFSPLQDLEWRVGDVIGSAVDVEERRATFYHLRKLPTFKTNTRNIRNASELRAPVSKTDEVYVEAKNVSQLSTNIGLSALASSAWTDMNQDSSGADKKTFRWGKLNGPNAIDVEANTVECVFFNSIKLTAPDVNIESHDEPTSGKLQLLIGKSYKDRDKTVSMALGTSIKLKLDEPYRFHQLGLRTKNKGDATPRKVTVLGEGGEVLTKCNLEKQDNEKEEVLLSPDKLKECRSLTVRFDERYGDTAENPTVELIGFRILGRIEDLTATGTNAGSARKTRQADRGFDFKAEEARRQKEEAMPQIVKVAATQIRRNFQEGDVVTIPDDNGKYARILRPDDHGNFELDVFADDTMLGVPEKRTLSRGEISTDPTERKYRPIVSADIPLEFDPGQTLKPVLSIHSKVSSFVVARDAPH